MLTNAQESAHNARVRLNYRTGPEKPEYAGARRLTYRRLCGFFVRGHHFLTSEASGCLYGGRFLYSGFLNPLCLAHHPEKMARGSFNLYRSLAMQVISAAQTQPSTFNLPFAITPLEPDNWTIAPNCVTQALHKRHNIEIIDIASPPPPRIIYAVTQSKPETPELVEFSLTW